MFAIIHKKSNKFVYGTDDRHYPPSLLRTSYDKMLTFATLEDAQHEFYARECSDKYKIVKLKPVEVECECETHVWNEMRKMDLD